MSKYLGHNIKVGKGNKLLKYNVGKDLHRQLLASRAIGILKNKKLPINLKRKIFDACTYTAGSNQRFRNNDNNKISNRTMKRIMLGVSLSMWPDRTMTDQTQRR